MAHGDAKAQLPPYGPRTVAQSVQHPQPEYDLTISFDINGEPAWKVLLEQEKHHRWSTTDDVPEVVQKMLIALRGQISRRQSTNRLIKPDLVKGLPAVKPFLHQLIGSGSMYSHIKIDAIGHIVNMDYTLNESMLASIDGCSHGRDRQAGASVHRERVASSPIKWDDVRQTTLTSWLHHHLFKFLRTFRSTTVTPDRLPLRLFTEHIAGQATDDIKTTEMSLLNGIVNVSWNQLAAQREERSAVGEITSSLITYMDCYDKLVDTCRHHKDMAAVHSAICQLSGPVVVDIVLRRMRATSPLAEQAARAALGTYYRERKPAFARDLKEDARATFDSLRYLDQD